MDNTVQVFTDRLKRMLADAEIDRKLCQKRDEQAMVDVYFGRIDCLHEVIAWADILEE